MLNSKVIDQRQNDFFTISLLGLTALFFLVAWTAYWPVLARLLLSRRVHHDSVDKKRALLGLTIPYVWCDKTTLVLSLCSKALIWRLTCAVDIAITFDA